MRAGRIPGAAIVLAALLAIVPTAGAGQHASAPPSMPQPCMGSTGAKGPVTKAGTASPDLLCGSREKDTLTAVGGGDTLWSYQGDDQLNARNGKVDLVYGGPGTDKGAFDACDKVYAVETQQASPPVCPGVRTRSLAGAAGDRVPYRSPAIECVKRSSGGFLVRFINQPTMRA